MKTFSPEELWKIGSLKWTGMTRSDGSPALGAWVAEMDFGTAPIVAETISNGIDNGLLGYTPTWLLPRLQDSVSAFQAKRFGWDLPPEAVRLTGAVLPALSRTITHLTRPDSPVVVPTPAYMPFLTIPSQLGRRVIEVPSLHGPSAGGKGWRLDVDGIERALKAGAGLVILCNPWNPTGRVLTEEELRDVHEVVARYDALIFADEIHSPLVLDESPFISYARLGEEYAAHTITATAATKGWNFAGLPNAHVLLPDPDLRRRWDAIPHSHCEPGIPTLGVLATIAAYESADLWQEEVLALIRRNIDYTESALEGTGVDFTRPQATYLTWWGVDALNLGAHPAHTILDRAAVAVNDGATLGSGYEQWVRVNLACASQTCDEIVERILRLAS